MTPGVFTLLGAVVRDAMSLPAAGDPRRHLEEAIAWLCRAQDAAGDGGVSRSYTLRFKRAHARKGWLAAYPETTGYIIPTFFDYARLTGRPEFGERALRMAQWEIEVPPLEFLIDGRLVAVEP